MNIKITFNGAMIIMFFVVAAIVLAVGGITVTDWEFWVIITCMLFIRVLASFNNGKGGE